MQTVNQKKHNHSRFAFLLACLLGLIAIRYSLQVDIPRVVFLAIIILICVLGDKSEIIAMLMCCIPLHESIDFFYALVFCNVIYVLKYLREIRIHGGVMIVFLLMIWELLHCYERSFSPMDFLVSMIPIIMLAIMMVSDLSDVDYPFVVRTFAFTTIAVFVVLLIKVFYFAGFNFASALAGLQRLGLDTEEVKESLSVSGGQINPNTLGIIGVLAVTGLAQLRQWNKYNRLDIIVACFLMVLGALTASRTYLACLAFMFIMLVFSEQGDIQKKIRFILLGFLILIAALVLLYLLFPDLLEYYISRFFEEDITTGRDETMFLYHNFLVSNPKIFLFGIGLQDFGERLIHEYRVTWVVPHNSIQELIIAWGIPGVFLFAGLMLCMYTTAARNGKKHRLINSVPLLIILFKGMAGQMLNSYYTMTAFSLAYLSLVQNFELSDNTQSSI